MLKNIVILFFSQIRTEAGGEGGLPKATLFMEPYVLEDNLGELPGSQMLDWHNTERPDWEKSRADIHR